MALLLSACGGGDDDAGSSTTEAADTAASGSASEVSSTVVDDEGESEQEATSEPDGTRTVDHALGSTEVPIEPERIVVLDPGTMLPTLLALDIEVAAAPLPEGEESLPTSLLSQDDIDAITSVGFPQLSLERVAAVEPDLIIGFDLALAESYDQLSAIAPTVAVELDLNDWRATAERVAAAIGAEEAMAAELAAYDERVEQLRTDLGSEIDTEVSIVRALGPTIRLHTRFHFAGQVIHDVGFPRPEAQQTDDPETRMIQVSLEELTEADGDILFVFGAGAQGSAGEGIDASIEAIRSHPLYPTLNVAQNDRVVVVDPLGWQQGGLPAANLILDDLRTAFLS